MAALAPCGSDRVLLSFTEPAIRKLPFQVSKMLQNAAQLLQAEAEAVCKLQGPTGSEAVQVELCCL